MAAPTFFRHEDLNANEYINNLTGLAKPLYRYTNLGGTFGGPLLIPGTRFNKSRTKLFFFFSEDYLQFLIPSTTTQFTMPTALERAGNYSQTTTTTGKLIPIIDPTTGQAYPGNVIPASRISPGGYAMLNLFPLPFATDPTGQRQYNTIYQFPLHDPHEDRILRLDYNVAPNTQAFVRLMNDYQGDRGIGSRHNSTGAWGEMVSYYGIQSAGAMATIVHTFSPNLVNEFTVGVNRALQSVSIPSSAQAQYQASLLPALRGPDGQPVTLPKIYNNNPENLIPTIKFTTLNAQYPAQEILRI